MLDRFGDEHPASQERRLYLPLVKEKAEILIIEGSIIGQVGGDGGLPEIAVAQSHNHCASVEKNDF